MPLIRALVSWRDPTELPKHACSNTLYFRVSDVPGFTSYEDLADDVLDAYVGLTNVGQVLPPGWNIQVRVYNMDDALPRPIKHESNGVLPGTKLATGPREVAICLSYYAERNLPRTRGRIYLGPIYGNGTNQPRPTNLMQTAAVTLGERLAAIGGEDQSWRVYSPKTGEDHHIRNVWCNDEWDTMRSRQLEATGRVTRSV